MAKKRLKLWLLPAILAAAGICWFDNFTVRTTHITLRCGTLPDAFSGLRIVQLADLHGRSFGQAHSGLLDAVRAAQPDVIALVGDLADEYTALPSLRPLLAGLTAIAPVYYVTGNHEWVMPRQTRQALFALLDLYGVIRLQNDWRVLERNGQQLVLAGVDDPNGPADQKHAPELVREIRASCGEDVPIVALCHRNDQLALWAKLGVAVVLSGHAHGGIVRIPGVGGVFGTHYEFFPGDEAGLYRQDGTQLYVSRGLGPSHRLPLRICNPPELPVITLTRG